MQKRADTLRPGGFVVLSAFDALVVQIAAEAPAFFEKQVAKALDVLNDARPFASADVEPDARARFDMERARKAMDDELVPPNGRGKRGDFSKDGVMLESQVKRDQASQGRAANAGMLRTGKCTVFAFHERLYFLDEEFRVAVGAAAAELGHMRGRVLADARFGVVHADDDEWLDRAGVDAVIGGLADVPVLPGNEGSSAVEEILTVVKIENRETAVRLFRIAGRGVNDKVALVAEKTGAEPFVFAELSGSHGAKV